MTLFQLVAGAIGVVGVAGIAVAQAQAEITRLDKDRSDLAATVTALTSRVATLESAPGYSLPTTISSGVTANCAAVRFLLIGTIQKIATKPTMYLIFSTI